MPSLNRLLVIAVLSLSVYVHAAPLRDPTRTHLAREIAATEHNAIVAPVDNFDCDEVKDDFDTTDSDEETELGSGVQDSSTLEDLALRKSKAKPAPKPPKVTPPKVTPPKQKSSKVVSSKTATKPPPQTTKATTAKLTSTAPPVTATAKSTSLTSTKATSTTRVTSETTMTTTSSKLSNLTTTSTTANPQKTETETKTKTQTKTATETATKSESATESETATPTESETETATPTATACSVITPESTSTAIAARAYNYVAQLFRRDDPEFIGWHGTNSDTAAFWTSQGQLAQPVNADGFLDFLGLGPNTTDGTGSGAESAIGPGVYVIDDQETAITFANTNARANANTTAQLCAIFAKSSATWRTSTPKAFIPADLVGDSADATTKAELEQARLDHIAQAVPGVNATSVVKFALLDPQRSTGQLVLPAQIADQFTATCFSADGGAAPSGTSTFPDFSYNGTTLRGEWNIASETAGTGDCA